ncbi:MAG: metallopeptidase TldD-related protein [Thermoanaerobaculia bacterium]|nr:metallopeptidase TldD-related protein [Thermoanaerobaculia bacterium]
MPFSRLDSAAIGRSLAQVADRPGDVAEVYLERLEVVSVADTAAGADLSVRREGGLAVRLLRDGLTWLASRDGFEGDELAAALRQVARAMPAAPYPRPRIELEGWTRAPEVGELEAFPGELERAVHARRAAFPWRLTVSRHRRDLQVVGPLLVPEPERESFYSVAVELPWGRHGTLLPALDDGAAARLADELVEAFRAREAAPPAAGPADVVLGAGACAVLLHEAVAHALESDTLLMGGRPEAAADQLLGTALLDVLDDPASAPETVRRRTDDEGMPVERRWLLRGGRVGQPLADLFAARSSPDLTPGAARRAGRHLPPVPRSTHLELLPREGSLDELVEETGEGLYFPVATRGALDPLTGEFTLELPHGRAISGGRLAAAVGRSRLRGRVAEILGSVSGVGGEAVPAGAGWCAKGGQRLPVWATAPPLRIDGAEIGP